MKIKPPYPVDQIPLPLRWDFVWCALPHAEELKSPAVYPRPCLVRSSGFMPLGGREIPWVNVAYCTKQIDKIDQHGLLIDDPDEMKACGLYEQTLVMTNRIKGLPWSPSFFMRRQRDNIGPVVGNMPYLVRLRTLSLMPQF